MIIIWTVLFTVIFEQENGYEQLLDILRDPKHEDYENYSEWAGEDFDPEKFDLEKTNRILRNIK